MIAIIWICYSIGLPQASYAALAVVTRDLLIINMWAGQFACEGFNWLLKRLIKQERPPGLSLLPTPLFVPVNSRTHLIYLLYSIPFLTRPPLTWSRSARKESLGSGYGFPSSHSQYMGYFSAFLIMHLFFRHRFQSSGYWVLDQLWRFVVYAALAGWAGVVCYSRCVFFSHPLSLPASFSTHICSSIWSFPIPPSLLIHHFL